MVEEPSPHNNPDTVQEAHQDWCAEQGIDPGSPLGKEALQMMVEASRDRFVSKDSLIAICDTYLEERRKSVRLGTPAIPTSGD